MQEAWVQSLTEITKMDEFNFLTWTLIHESATHSGGLHLHTVSCGSVFLEWARPKYKGICMCVSICYAVIWQVSLPTDHRRCEASREVQLLPEQLLDGDGWMAGPGALCHVLYLWPNHCWPGQDQGSGPPSTCPASCWRYSWTPWSLHGRCLQWFTQLC